MRNVPASRSSMAPKTLGPSKRGRHIHSTAPLGATSAHVSQSERNAYSAIGGDGGTSGMSDSNDLARLGPRDPLRVGGPRGPVRAVAAQRPAESPAEGAG